MAAKSKGEFEYQFAGKKRTFRLPVAGQEQLEDRTDLSIGLLLDLLATGGARVSHMIAILHVTLTHGTPVGDEPPSEDEVRGMIEAEGLASASRLCGLVLGVTMDPGKKSLLLNAAHETALLTADMPSGPTSATGSKSELAS